jgi:hypothetical protein
VLQIVRMSRCLSGRSRRLVVSWCIIIAALVFQLPPTSAQKSQHSKKIIYYGWGIPDTQYVRSHWREMEDAPFDGIGISVAIDRDSWQRGARGNANQLGWQIMSSRRFRHEDFRETICDLKSANWQHFTENFLPVVLSSSMSATGLNWFDDERWSTISANFAVIARIAEQGGAKGLMLDPEHYGYPLFSYAEQRSQLDRSYEDYVAAARRRGREVMTSIAREKHDAVLLSFYAYTLVETQATAHGSRSNIRYSLLGAFYDGFLEAMPDQSRFVDGFEFAYGYKTRRPFVAAYNRIHSTGSLYSAVPELYYRRVEAGFGLRIDNQDGFDYFSPVQFREALRHAVDVSDGYVWIYGQIPRFFPKSEITEEYIQAISSVRASVGNQSKQQ